MVLLQTHISILSGFFPYWLLVIPEYWSRVLCYLVGSVDNLYLTYSSTLIETPNLPNPNYKESACNVEEPDSTPGLGIFLEKGMQLTPVFLPGKSQG